MKMRLARMALIAHLGMSGAALAQSPAGTTPREAYVDPTNGLTLAEAIVRAIEQQPALQAARRDVDAARGLALHASFRPNPSVSFERREEPAGTDNLTTVGIEWPLDLFRKAGRVEVATREVTTAERMLTERERLLAAEVRDRYGAVAGATRELAVLDEVIGNVRRRRDLLAARVQERAAPPLERDLVEVEVQRLEATRALQAGEAGVALLNLKRLLGMTRPSARCASATRSRTWCEQLAQRQWTPPRAMLWRSGRTCRPQRPVSPSPRHASTAPGRAVGSM